jgi:putative ATP-binding cassette transporter
MMVQKRYHMIYFFFSQVEVIVTLFLLGPAFLRGEATLGTVMAVNRAAGLLSGSLFWFASSYGSIANWRASTGRLIRFEEAMSRHLKVQAGAKVDLPKSASNGLEIDRLKVWTPAAIASPSSKELCQQEDEQLPEIARVVLLEGLSLSIPTGSKVLISGPSGAGKSTLFRALSGAWPWAEGGAAAQGGLQGVRVFPTEVFVLPGQLREAVAYPLPLGGDRVTREHPDKDIADALRIAGLGHLLEDGLDCERDWGLALSAGQKARLSLARLVFHKPRVAALDEPVAHLDMPARAPLLKAALDALPETTVLVISHDMTEEIQELFDSKFALDVQNRSLRGQ